MRQILLIDYFCKGLELSKEPTVKASEYLQKLTELELELTAEKDTYSHPVRQTLRLRGKIKDESSQL